MKAGKEGEGEDEEEDENRSILILKDLIRKLIGIFENKNEYNSRKRPRMSPQHRNTPSTNRQSPDPAQKSVAGGSHIQGRLQTVLQ